MNSGECESTIDLADYRRALGHYATGVAVITARGANGRKLGLTANSFTSVSLDPPFVSWCPSKKSVNLADLENAGFFAVNVLAADQHHLSRKFANPSAERFEGVPHVSGIDGLPLIEGAVARFQCRNVSQIDAGDHMIVLGEVMQYDAIGGDPLVYHRGGYRIATSHPEL